MSRTRVIIIGSGVFGIATARIYLKLDPSIDLTILEADSTLGGTWSRDRSYPTLTTQQPLGSYEFPDREILPNAKPGDLGVYEDFIPTHIVYEYLEKVAKDEGITDKIIFNTKVVKVEKIGTVEDPHGWALYIQNGRQDGHPDYTCDKLIIATGQTSEENIPESLIVTTGSLPIVHSKYMGKSYDKIAGDSVSKVTIYGGGKSAFDAVYMCVKAGKKVDWVIRPDEVGGGPCGFAPARSLGQRSDDLISSRWAATQHPSLSTLGNFWYRLYHSGKNPLGYWYNGFYWSFLSWLLFKMLPFYSSENGKKLIPAVKPSESTYWWVNKASGIITQPEMPEWIAKGEKITVHRATITAVSSNSLTLVPDSKSGIEPFQLPSNALILCTGYKAFFSALFLHSPELSASLGLPTPLSSIPPHITEKWEPLTRAADEKISKLFPRLVTPPPVRISSRKYSPARLYRYSIPTEYVRHNDRSLVIVGMSGVLNMATWSHISGLWTVAWLTGRLNPLNHLTMEEIEMEVAEQSIWPVRRYLNIGLVEPYSHIYETIPIFDTFMKDLGLNPYRKKGWYSENFDPYHPRDYRGIMEEYMAKEGLSSDERPREY